MKKNSLFLILFICFFRLGYSQNLSQYTFSQSDSFFSIVTNGTVLGNEVTDDQRFLDPNLPSGTSDFIGIGLPIGFNFHFNGFVYNRFGVNSNGWISLGSSLLTPSVDMTTTSSYEPLSSNSINISNALVARICAFSRDLMTQNGGEIRYAVSGTSPNQILVVQWINFAKYLADGDSYNFQIKLYESSNIIEICYGVMSNNATATIADCGLRASPNNIASNFSNRKTDANWSATTPGTLATDKVLLSNTIFPTSGLTFTWTPPPSCSGAPTPGNTISSTALACNDVNFELSLQNSVLGSGISCQWQTSTDGITYVNASGFSSDVNYTVNQSIATYYQCQVTCLATGIISTSTPLLITMNSPLNCFCLPIYLSGKTEGDLISMFSISGTTLTNNSGTLAVNPSYTYYIGQPNYTSTLQASSSYTIEVTVGTFGNQNIAAWIDYNDDGFFTISERIGYTNAAINANGSVSFPIVLACNPPLGIHRMRVRDVWDTPGINIDPCEIYSRGETEDYNITISAPILCPQPSGLFVTDATGTAITLGWESGCAETAWNVFVTTSGGPAPTTTATYNNVGNPFFLNGLTPGTSYDFYVNADCQNNETSLWTEPYLFSTTPINDTCSGAIPLSVGYNFDSNALTATLIASSNSSAPASGCGSYLGGDVWFTVLVPASGNVTIETGAANGNPIFNTGIAVYSGNCSDLTLVSCNDNGATAFPSITLLGRTPGELLYVLVWKFDDELPYGQFQVAAFDCPSATPAPVGDTTQIFCSTATVGDLYANGSTLKWYSSLTDETPLDTTTYLVTGIYYATQTINCESFNRLAVSVIVSSFPIVSNTILNGCDDGFGTAVFNLTAANSTISSEIGLSFVYFTDLFEAESNSNPILNPSTFSGTNGQTIFVKVENTNGCYSISELLLNTFTTLAPTGTANQTFCGAATLSNLVVVGTDVIWYTETTGGSILPSSTPLLNGTFYYASQTENGCESLSRLEIRVTEDCPFVGCLSAPNGQLPLTTFTPNCLGIPEIITPLGFAGQYSKVSVIAGVEYVFTSSITTDVLTISNENGTLIYTFGVNGSLVWTSTISGVIRFYTHVDQNCLAEQVFRERAILCGTPPPVLINDECLGAIGLITGGVFTDNFVIGTNFGATDTTGIANPTCSSYLGGDVWYSVVVPNSGNVTIETNTNDDSITDTGIEIFAGNCADLTSISCNDDAGIGFFSSSSLTTLTPGSTIFVRVFANFNVQFGTFQIAAYDASLATSTFDNSSFYLYPNFVIDVLTISYSQNINSVQVLNLLGQEVFSKVLNSSQSQIDMSTIPSGTYLLKVNSNNQFKTIKIIKR